VHADVDACDSPNPERSHGGSSNPASATSMPGIISLGMLTHPWPHPRTATSSQLRLWGLGWSGGSELGVPIVAPFVENCRSSATSAICESSSYWTPEGLLPRGTRRRRRRSLRERQGARGCSPGRGRKKRDLPSSTKPRPSSISGRHPGWPSFPAWPSG